MRFVYALEMLGVGAVALLVFSGTNNWSSNLASLGVFSDENSECREALQHLYPDIHKDDIEMRSTDLDGDGDHDHIVHFTTSEQCGSGGCLFELCKRNDSGGVEHIQFGYAAHTLEVQNTLTNNMRDIKVNGDDSLTLQWNGTSYELVN